MARQQARFAKVAFRGWTLLVFLFLFLPILVVVIYSFNGGRNLYIWTEFSTDWYGRALASPRVTSALLVSLQAALINGHFRHPQGSGRRRSPSRHVDRSWVRRGRNAGTVSAIADDLDGSIGLYNGIAISIGHSLFNIAVVALIVRAGAGRVG
jgi:ABC-type spermidine/putrescine transport system permease subunit II